MQFKVVRNLQTTGFDKAALNSVLGDPEVIRVLLRGKKVKVSLESKDKYQDTPLKVAVR